MKKRRSAKLINEGRYVAEVDIDLLDTKEGWLPYLSLEDAIKLDNVRSALRRGDLENADSTKRILLGNSACRSSKFTWRLQSIYVAIFRNLRNN